MNDSLTSSPALGSYRMYIDGKWSNGEASETIEVGNPANEAIIATIPGGTVNDARRALEAAKRAQPKWAALPAIERAKLLHNSPTRSWHNEIMWRKSSPLNKANRGFHNGWRISGLGGEDGKYGLDGYFRKQTIYVNFA